MEFTLVFKKRIVPLLLNRLFLSKNITITILFITMLSVRNSDGSPLDFYVKLPEKPNEKIVDKVDIAVYQSFNLTCEADSTVCDNIAIYAGTEEYPFVAVVDEFAPVFGPYYESKAEGNIKIDHEYTTSRLFLELNVFHATTQLFDKDIYKCKCSKAYVGLEFPNQNTIEIKLHEQTKPRDMTILQDPDSPYLEGQKVKFSCAAEAWPSKTKFTIRSGQQEICQEVVYNSKDGIICEVEIEYSKNKSMECVASNLVGESIKSFTMVIYANDEEKPKEKDPIEEKIKVLLVLIGLNLLLSFTLVLFGLFWLKKCWRAEEEDINITEVENVPNEN